MYTAGNMCTVVYTITFESEDSVNRSGSIQTQQRSVGR